MPTRLLISIYAALALTACASDPTARVCSTGIVCPSPLQCAAVQAVCITNNCGNGHLDPGEVCDDGNIMDGDGCSHDCLSLEVCGNGIVDPGEVCDDGNTVSGDGCSADCKSNETCGNGIVDIHEVCDDGNTFNGKCSDDTGCNADTDCTSGSCIPDGCSSNCKSNETCGNCVVDFDEVCDDCNTVNGDGCSSDCQSGEGCGNGVVDPGEQCDDGNTDNNDDCTNDCKVNVCGDGIVDTDGTHKEQCDGGALGGTMPVETAACNLDCTTAMCGDGRVNKTAGEQCDNVGLDADDEDCTSQCKINVCGDGLVDTLGTHVEQCDDGNTINNDGCTNQCTLPHCGNGIVDMGEQCDLGAANSDTGPCTTSCALAVCGDHKVEAGVEQCDGTAGLQPCSATCKQEICGNGIIDVDAAHGIDEQCDDGNTVNGDGCSSTCKFEYCGDGIVNNHEVCDWALTPATCNLDCTISMCGDGKVNPHAVPPEQCDGTPGCSASCQLEQCGNGVLDPGEQCDGSLGLQPCNDATCQQKKCGNSIVDTGTDNLGVTEQCDNGTALNVNTNACTATCQIAKCGDGFIEAGIEECDNGLTTGNADDKDCTADCKINTCGDGKIDTTGTHHEDCDDGAMNGLPGHCDAFCHVASCGNGLVDNGEQCDSGGVDSSTCDGATCTTPRCGDGYTNLAAGENCDMGTANTNTPTCPNGETCMSCDLTCQPHTIMGGTCGDGIVQAATCPADPSCVTASPLSCCTAEQCDDAGATQSDVSCTYAATDAGPCTFCHSCKIVAYPAQYCGDGIMNGGEACDDGEANGTVDCQYDATSCQVCTTSCTLTPGTLIFCGDLIKNGPEECDGMDLGGATCASLGMSGSGLKCKMDSSCTYDESGCTP